MKSPRPALTRSLQVGFLVLLGLCTAQLAYWLADEVAYTAGVQTRLRKEYESDARGAQAMLRGGWAWSRLETIYPNLTMGADSVVSVRTAVLDDLEAQRFHRLNRYAWEGGFFLVVLLAAMAVVYRALREEAVLRRRQEHFLDAVSHELKSPLASLRLSVETLALRDLSAERRAELIRRMLADLRRLERMDTNVLEASRLDAGHDALPTAPVALGAEVNAVVEELHEQASESGVAVTSDVGPGVGIHADEERVRTVLRNLLHNAVRAATAGGHVAVHAEESSGNVRLEVRDDGVGFPPELAQRLFEKFYRIDTNEPGRQGGTGLGLYLVRRCVELDGGTVSAESAGSGGGAVFTVTWPIAGAVES